MFMTESQIYHIMNIFLPNPSSAYGRSKLAGEKYALTSPWFNDNKNIMALFIIRE